MEAGEAWAYIRCSSDEQIDGSSLPRQREVIETYAAQGGVTISNWLIDDGVSARDGHNLRFGRIATLRADVMSGRITRPITLIAEDPDRVSRAAVEEAMEFFTSMLNRRVTFAFAGTGKVFAKGQGHALMQLFENAINWHGSHEENEKRRGRVIKAVEKQRWAVVAGNDIFVERPPTSTASAACSRSPRRDAGLGQAAGAVPAQVFATGTQALVPRAMTPPPRPDEAAGRTPCPTAVAAVVRAPPGLVGSCAGGGAPPAAGAVPNQLQHCRGQCRRARPALRSSVRASRWLQTGAWREHRGHHAGQWYHGPAHLQSCRGDAEPAWALEARNLMGLRAYRARGDSEAGGDASC